MKLPAARWVRQLLFPEHKHRWEALPGVLGRDISIDEAARTWGVVCTSCSEVHLYGLTLSWAHDVVAALNSSPDLPPCKESKDA